MPLGDRNQAEAWFGRLKGLEGTLDALPGTSPFPGDGATIEYSVTSAGHTLVETLFPGTPQEMVTLYTLDGGHLVLTHYCAFGNQPRMRAVEAGENGLRFQFVDAGDMTSLEDGHMHGLVLTFLDDDRFRAVWESWEDGAPAGEAVFDVERRPEQP